jgi:hypothetical protein
MYTPYMTVYFVISMQKCRIYNIYIYIYIYIIGFWPTLLRCNCVFLNWIVQRCDSVFGGNHFGNSMTIVFYDTPIWEVRP